MDIEGKKSHPVFQKAFKFIWGGRGGEVHHCSKDEAGSAMRTCPADCPTEHLPPYLSHIYCGNRILQRSREFSNVKHPEAVQNQTSIKNKDNLLAVLGWKR